MQTPSLGQACIHATHLPHLHITNLHSLIQTLEEHTGPIAIPLRRFLHIKLNPRRFTLRRKYPIVVCETDCVAIAVPELSVFAEGSVEGVGGVWGQQVAAVWGFQLEFVL